MPGPDETFIVRVRPQEGDAVVEQPRRSRRRRVRDVSEVGQLIERWLGRPADPEEDAMRSCPFVFVAVAACLAATGCGDEESAAAPERAASPKPAGTVLRVTAPRSGSGAFHFDVKRLEAPAGRVTLELVNRDEFEFPHNLRIQTGSKCCFKEGSKDVGGTDTTNGGTTARAAVELKPGRYVFLCSLGGHYDGDGGKMRGTLVIR